MSLITTVIPEVSHPMFNEFSKWETTSCCGCVRQQLILKVIEDNILKITVISQNVFQRFFSCIPSCCSSKKSETRHFFTEKSNRTFNIFFYTEENKNELIQITRSNRDVETITKTLLSKINEIEKNYNTAIFKSFEQKMGERKQKKPISYLSYPRIPPRLLRFTGNAPGLISSHRRQTLTFQVNDSPQGVIINADQKQKFKFLPEIAVENNKLTQSAGFRFKKSVTWADHIKTGDEGICKELLEQEIEKACHYIFIPIESSLIFQKETP